MQHHTCFRHWLNTAAGGIAVSPHLTVPVLHVFQLDIYYLLAAMPCYRPPYFQPWFTCSTVRQLPASPHSPTFHAVCRSIHHYCLFEWQKSAPINHYAPRLRILPHYRQFLFAVADGGPPSLTIHPTLRLNIGPRTAAVASRRSSAFSLWRAVNPV